MEEKQWWEAVYECVKEVGEGFSGIKEKRERMTKGGRRDEEHEVGLDKTMDLQVTFELLSVRRPDYGFVGKDSVEESVFFSQRLQQI